MPFSLHRKVFERIGGFNEDVNHGEDHQLVWEARRKEIPLTRIPGTLFTSARRYRDGGWIPTTIQQAKLDGVAAMAGAMKLFLHKLTDI